MISRLLFVECNIYEYIVEIIKAEIKLKYDKTLFDLTKIVKNELI